ncbi:hypothetical protein G7Y89_g2628 [Cudoniella acicularis]|uniref:Uncharacterized protein n=1 Tax=Cudoniella acicularis TaxID=354080 RepID=A0A8H4RTT3_9HELO|nr:hypothetical protein G7Y89_g2628 [Cudoniella acicularis]
MPDPMFWDETLGLNTHRQKSVSGAGIDENGLGIGCIVWLSATNPLDEPVICIRPHHCNNSVLNAGGFNHPAVVLKQDLCFGGPPFYSIAMMTSKNSATGSRYPRLRIADTNAVPSEFNAPPELFLEHGTMGKSSFVVTNHVYQVRGLHLRDFRSGKPPSAFRISQQSYGILMDRLGLEPEPWVSTAVLDYSATSQHKTQPQINEKRPYLANRALTFPRWTLWIMLRIGMIGITKTGIGTLDVLV